MYPTVSKFSANKNRNRKSCLHCIDIHDDDCTILFYYRSEDFPDIVPGKLIFSILKHKTYLKDNF